MTRRLFDIAVASVALVLTSPVLAAAIVAIRLETRGHPIYRQRRIGKDGRPFDMLKLRTMVAGAESMGSGLAVNEGDPRITRVGAILRRTSLDEIPNLLNVLRGEMSLVGPRPLPAEDGDFLGDVRRRLLVRPGITGLWQVSGRSDLDFDDLVRLDFLYLERWSPFLDLAILAKTIPAVITRKGAY